jgi:hypothetical protein
VNPQTTGPAAAVEPRNGSRHLHAFLDAIFPGLGHLLARRWKLAALFGLPVIAILAGTIFALATSTTGGLLAIALNPATILILFLGEGLLLLWRATSVT